MTSDGGGGETEVSALREALYRGDNEAARALVDAGATVNVFDAAALGDDARLREALTAEPGTAMAWSADGFTALHLAAFLGGVDAVALLLDHGADVGAVSQNPMTVQPLHSAAARGDVESCRLLLDHGANANAAQQGGFTPLDAALHAHDEPLRALLETYGAIASGNVAAE